MPKNFAYFYIISQIYCTICTEIVNSLIYQDEDPNSFQLDKYKLMMKSIKTMSVKYCDLQITDLLIKSLMNNTRTIMINEDVIHSDNMHMNIDYLILTNSDNGSLIEKCINSKIPQANLIYRTILIIYDMTLSPANNQIEGRNNWQYVGSANVLYLTGDQCWQMSPPYMFNRSLSKAHACDIWHINEYSVPDMQGQAIEAVTFHRPLSTIINFNQTVPSKRYDGIEMNIFMEMVKRLNLSWRVNELRDEVNKWGKLEGDHWVGGMMEALTSGSADVGFSTIWLSPMHIPYMDYTISWNSISSVFLVPRPTLIGSTWTSLFRPFTVLVWYSIIFVLVLFPLVSLAIVRFHCWITQQKLATDATIANYYMYTLGTITGGSGDLGNVRQLPVRFLVAWWYVFVMLLCNTYTSNIVADITMPSFTPKINTVQQLVEQDFSWGTHKTQKNVEDHLDVMFDLQKYWQTKLAKRIRVFEKEERRKLILEKKMVIRAQIMDNSNYLVLDDPIENDLADFLRVMKERIQTYRCAIAVRKHSRLLPAFNVVLQRLIETGLIQHLKEDVTRRFREPSYEKMTLDVGPGLPAMSALTLNNYRFMFYVLIVGWITSGLCFLLELIF